MADFLNDMNILNKINSELLTLMDIQMKNNFEIIFYPQNPISSDLMVKKRQLRHTIKDQIVTRLYIQNALFTMDRFEMENANDQRYIKSVENATEITLTFIEDTASTVRSWYIDWLDSIMYYNRERTVVFRDNQKAVKKDAKLLLLNGIGGIAPVWVTITGIRPKNITPLDLGQLVSEPDILTITFDCESISFTKSSVTLG